MTYLKRNKRTRLLKLLFYYWGKLWHSENGFDFKRTQLQPNLVNRMIRRIEEYFKVFKLFLYCPLILGTLDKPLQCALIGRIIFYFVKTVLRPCFQRPLLNCVLFG